MADPEQSLDSEQISPATIAHHTVYENTPNLQQSHVCQWGVQPYLAGLLSRLVGKPPFSPSLLKNVLPLTKAANGPNSAISLMQTFGRILFYVCKGGSYGNKILYKNLDLTQDFPNKISFHFLWVKMLPTNLPKIFRWPEMCPLHKILAQDFQMAAFTKILGRRDTSVASASLHGKL